MKGIKGDEISKLDDHVEVVRKAIEFNKPYYLPMEIVDVPGIYNAYHTLDPYEVQIIPGCANFDALWTNCYSWFHEEISKTAEGESIKKDQFGIVLKVPQDKHTTYIILENPLSGKNNLKGYDFPDPDATDPYYQRLGEVIRNKYPDRFINGYIDAGIFLTTMFLFGEQQFLIKIIDNVQFVIEVYEMVMEYYKALIPKYKKAGAHMITAIEDIGSTSSLLIHPDIWRNNFKPIIHDFFKFVHRQGLYTGLLIDGNCGQILDDLLEMDIDVFSTFDINTTGIDLMREKLKGKICLKATVDMQTTLPRGTPEEVADAAHELVSILNTPGGGFICEVVRWHRPEYPIENVIASAQAFDQYRTCLDGGK
jgi:hypothetical protein